MNIFPLTNTFILLAISVLHFFWAFGGRWGAEAVIPTNKEGQRMLNSSGNSPSVFTTLVVAFGLLTMALLHLEKVQMVNLLIPTWVNTYGLKIIAGIFLIRAVGDFHYVGFFKKVKRTKFADLDTKFYSPLCLILSINAFITAFHL